MIGAVLGGLSAVASGLAAIKNFQSAQDAQKSANLYGQQFAGITETDKYKALKSRDISSSVTQRTAAQNAAAVQAAVGMGPEGAAQITGIAGETNRLNLEAMTEQAKLDAQMELQKAEGAQGVEARNIAAQREFKAAQLVGAQTAASDLYNAGIEGVTGSITNAGLAAAGLTTSSKFDYGLKAARIQKLIEKGMTLEEATAIVNSNQD